MHKPFFRKEKTRFKLIIFKLIYKMIFKLFFKLILILRIYFYLIYFLNKNNSYEKWKIINIIHQNELLYQKIAHLSCLIDID